MDIGLSVAHRRREGPLLRLREGLRIQLRAFGVLHRQVVQFAISGKLDFKYDVPGIGKGGTATLTVDGKQVADGKIARTIPFRVSADETFDVGEDTGTPVSEDYKVPVKFTGTLNKVVI